MEQGQLEKMVAVITKDGDQWCALIGDDIQSGIAGFGDTPSKALADLGENMRSTKPKSIVVVTKQYVSPDNGLVFCASIGIVDGITRIELPVTGCNYRQAEMKVYGKLHQLGVISLVPNGNPGQCQGVGLYCEMTGCNSTHVQIPVDSMKKLGSWDTYERTTTR